MRPSKIQTLEGARYMLALKNQNLFYGHYPNPQKCMAIFQAHFFGARMDQSMLKGGPPEITFPHLDWGCHDHNMPYSNDLGGTDRLITPL